MPDLPTTDLFIAGGGFSARDVSIGTVFNTDADISNPAGQTTEGLGLAGQDFNLQVDARQRGAIERALADNLLQGPPGRGDDPSDLLRKRQSVWTKDPNRFRFVTD